MNTKVIVVDENMEKIHQIIIIDYKIKLVKIKNNQKNGLSILFIKILARELTLCKVGCRAISQSTNTYSEESLKTMDE